MGRQQRTAVRHGKEKARAETSPQAESAAAEAAVGGGPTTATAPSDGD